MLVTYLSYIRCYPFQTPLHLLECKELVGVEDTHTTIVTRMFLEDTSGYVQASISYISQHKSSLLILLVLPLVPFAYLDYQGWYNLGTGGLPHNVLGWLVQSLLSLPASRNVRDASSYDEEVRNTELEKTSILGDRLPAWEGDSPKTGKWVVPHRQIEQGASAEIKKVCLFAYQVNQIRRARHYKTSRVFVLK